MPQYKEQFPKGTLVRVKSHEALEAFKKEWRYHHPLGQRQLDCAGKEGRVASVSFYHGGDVLYTIESMSGLWHGQCLEPPMKKEPNQPPQRNAGSRPSSGDSQASETPSSLGPRG